jgi:ABC-type antimicrobial peptide transport system permease subunit
MRRRYVVAAGVELVVIALVSAMFGFSVHMVRQERDWREQGRALGPFAQLGLDLSMWWLSYWWVAAPMLVLGGLGLAAVIAFSGRPAPPAPAGAAGN